MPECDFTGNILGEATKQLGNNLREAMRQLLRRRLSLEYHPRRERWMPPEVSGEDNRVYPISGAELATVALDAPMVLFDPVTLADPDLPTSATILQAICDVTGNDSLLVGLATIDDDAVGPATTCKRPSARKAGSLAGRTEGPQTSNPPK
ncbi:hypothetical protein BQ8482_290081 [Mesorhizobium delmotii]|uniref:Uncharacterized protein n=1 Tax=Mesorhizobium delmotii TaxID=1631247 RepID=A0A2P9AMZ2_9HYPH|nr:hypothetical protein BQ8482_290081 [Mesorhizobium delmotii]